MQRSTVSLEKPSELHSIYHNEMKLIHVCRAMEARGILIDKNYVMKGLEYEQEKLAVAKGEFRAKTGEEYKDSGALFKKVFDRNGEAYGTTDKGNPSFTSEILEKLDSPTARLINQVRHHEKRIGTYWSSFLYHADQTDTLRANIRPSGTTTGRFSYSDPNLQNLPAEEDDESHPIRGAFIPRPGRTFVSIDYQAMEYRIFLDMAGEHALIDKVNQGHDLHQATSDLMGVKRYEAKTLGFMLLYGGGIKKLARSLGVTEAHAKGLRDLYFGRLPKVKRLIREIIKTAEGRGYIRNPFGRRCWLGDFNFSYKMPNALVQGTCADIMKHAMVNIHEEGLTDIEMLVTIHDELLFEGTNLDAVPKIIRCMEEVYKPWNGLPMVAKAAYSTKSFAKRDLNEGIHL